MPRYASRFNKRDQSEPSIIDAFERMGISYIEAGPLDGWVYFPKGQGWTPVEFKTGNAPLTKGQQAFVQVCIDLERPVLVLRSAEEAIEAVLQRAGEDRA